MNLGRETGHRRLTLLFVLFPHASASVVILTAGFLLKNIVLCMRKTRSIHFCNESKFSRGGSVSG